MSPAERLIGAMLHPTVGGALYDFLGYLTTQEIPIVVGSSVPVYDILDAFEDWLSSRGIVMGGPEPDVEGWENGGTI